MEPQQSAENRTIFQEDGICKKAEGDAWARQGNYDKAIVCYNKACFVNPDDYTLYSARGNAYTKLCDFKSAISNYKKLLSMQSNPPQAIKEEIAEVFNAQGYTYLMEKEYTTAIVYLTDAVALDALQANYWLHRCLAYIGLENWTKALKDIDHAICIDANDADILVLRAKLNWKLKLIDKGNSDIARAFKLNPNHREVRYEVSSLQIDTQVLSLVLTCTKGDYDAAMADVERASQAFFKKKRQSDQPHTNDPDELDEHIQELDSQSLFGSPVAHIDEHPEITRQRNLILNGRSFNMHMYDDTSTHACPGRRRSGRNPKWPLRRRPERDEPRTNTLDLSIDETPRVMEQAIASEVATASRFDGSVIDYRFYVNRGDCYRAQSKNHAVTDYNSALELQPMDADIHTRVAIIRYQFGLEQFNRGAFDKAEVEFTLAIRHNPSVYHYYIRRGDCYRYLEVITSVTIRAFFLSMVRSQQNEMAFQDYKKAEVLNPDDPDVKVLPRA
ncbi:hypothetical protein DYB32_003356 [Aphanomyces invadans]|uniref:Uncharacterized protein n=1 Tax=Aphanomyces invadans TaxID=157072 RepID=A0A3R6Z1A6_9STRA|nr:hypothetical protein DYB32_003356 [Aphanomyces invadans]